MNTTRKSLLLKNLSVCLDNLHGSGIAHGAISLANIWIEDMFYVSLGPFGLPSEPLGGLLLFLPPEAVLSEDESVTQDCFEGDIWAMAIVFCLLRYGPKMYREMEKVACQAHYLQFMEIAFGMNLNADFTYASYQYLRALKAKNTQKYDRGTHELDLEFLEDCREDMNKITLLPSVLNFEPGCRISSKDLICLDLMRETPTSEFKPRSRPRAPTIETGSNRKENESLHDQNDRAGVIKARHNKWGQASKANENTSESQTASQIYYKEHNTPELNQRKYYSHIDEGVIRLKKTLEYKEKPPISKLLNRPSVERPPSAEGYSQDERKPRENSIKRPQEQNINVSKGIRHEADSRDDGSHRDGGISATRYSRSRQAMPSTDTRYDRCRVMRDGDDGRVAVRRLSVADDGGIGECGRNEQGGNVRPQGRSWGQRTVDVVLESLENKEHIATFGADEDDRNDSKKYINEPEFKKYSTSMQNESKTKTPARQTPVSNSMRKQDHEKPYTSQQISRQPDRFNEAGRGQSRPFFNSSNTNILDIDCDRLPPAKRIVSEPEDLNSDENGNTNKWTTADTKKDVRNTEVISQDKRRSEFEDKNSHFVLGNEPNEPSERNRKPQKFEFYETLIIKCRKSRSPTPTRALSRDHSRRNSLSINEVSVSGRNNVDNKILSIIIKVSSLRFIEPLELKGSYISSMLTMKQSLIAESSTSFATEPISGSNLSPFGGSFTFKLPLLDIDKLDDVRLDLTVYHHAERGAFKRYLANASIDTKACLVNCALGIDAVSHEAKWCLLRNTQRHPTAVVHVDTVVEVCRAELVSRVREDSLEKKGPNTTEKKSQSKNSEVKTISEEIYIEYADEQKHTFKRDRRDIYSENHIHNNSESHNRRTPIKDSSLMHNYESVAPPRNHQKTEISSIKPSFSFGKIGSKPLQDKKEVLKREIDDLRNSLDTSENLNEYPKALSLLRELITRGRPDSSIEPN